MYIDTLLGNKQIFVPNCWDDCKHGGQTKPNLSFRDLARFAPDELLLVLMSFIFKNHEVGQFCSWTTSPDCPAEWGGVRSEVGNPGAYHFAHVCMCRSFPWRVSLTLLGGP